MFFSCEDHITTEEVLQHMNKERKTCYAWRQVLRATSSNAEQNRREKVGGKKKDVLVNKFRRMVRLCVHLYNYFEQRYQK